MVFASISVSVWLPRLWRFIFCERLIRPWRFMPGPASTLPVAVILNRFLTDDFVFILGIWSPFCEQSLDGRRGSACPFQARSRRPGARYRGGGKAAHVRVRGNPAFLCVPPDLAEAAGM